MCACTRRPAARGGEAACGVDARLAAVRSMLENVIGPLLDEAIH
jgi:hypothetical protein